jgi:drug/metabolite transporter (DMT)-like permease
MPYLSFLAICIFWGMNFLLMKKSLLYFTPINVAALRLAGGGLFLLFIYIARKQRWPLTTNQVWGLLLLTLIGYAWPFGIQPYLIEHCGSGFIGMMVSFVPLVTLIVSIPMLGTHPTARQLIGVIGGLIFLSLLFADGLQHNVTAVDFILALTVPTGYAICNTYIKRHFAGVPALPLTLCCLGAAFLLLAPFAAAHPIQETAMTADLPLAITCLVVLGVVGTGVSLVVFTRLVQTKGPLFAGMVAYIIPVIAILLGYFDGEQVSKLQLVAIAGILVMEGLVQWPTPKDRQVAAKEKGHAR